MKKLENMYYLKAVELAATITKFLGYSYGPYIHKKNYSFFKKADQISETLALVINNYMNKSTWITEDKFYQDDIAVKLSPARNSLKGQPMPPKENIVPFSAIKKVLEKFGFNIEDFEFAPDRSVYAYSSFNEEETCIWIKDFDEYNCRSFLRVGKNNARNGRLNTGSVKVELIEEELLENGAIRQNNKSVSDGEANFERFVNTVLRTARGLAWGPF